MYKNLIQDTEDGAMTFFCNIQDVLRITFKIFICYLTAQINIMHVLALENVFFISIYFEQFVVLLSAFYICSLYLYT
jgi:hypothetical protein